jgi:hypothetical protein
VTTIALKTAEILQKIKPDRLRKQTVPHRGPKDTKAAQTERGATVMAMCTFCGNDMIHGTTCSEERLRISDVEYEPIRWGEEKGYPFQDMTERCDDCNVAKGAVHHHGCCLEQCPACHRQAISCGCMDDCAPAEPPDESGGQAAG